MIRKNAVLITLIVIPFIVFAQKSQKESTWETLIGDFLYSYSLSSDNIFRLAAYSELKGKYSSQHNSLSLSFGYLGSITFFQNHCLLKNYRNQVLHINKGEGNTPMARAMDDAVSDIFEKILLLSNQNAADDFITFVDRQLARKNMEPFDKVFLRHILLKHGRYDRQNERVEFYSDWLEERSFSNSLSSASHEEMLIQKYRTPLRILLDENILRGWYIDAGGTVFVEDVDRPVFYATGEQYDQNVVAFKVFLQKLFVESVQFLVNTEAKRIDNIEGSRPVKVDMPADPVSITQTTFFPEESQEAVQVKKTSSGGEEVVVRPLYTEYSWIPMMLNILRSRDINVADPDIIQFFVDEPYFPKIYDRMTPAEKQKADQYMARR